MGTNFVKSCEEGRGEGRGEGARRGGGAQHGVSPPFGYSDLPERERDWWGKQASVKWLQRSSSQVLLPSDKAWGTSSCIHKPHFCVNPEGRPVVPLDDIDSQTQCNMSIVSLFKDQHSLIP